MLKNITELKEDFNGIKISTPVFKIMLKMLTNITKRFCFCVISEYSLPKFYPYFLLQLGHIDFIHDQTGLWGSVERF